MPLPAWRRGQESSPWQAGGTPIFTSGTSSRHLSRCRCRSDLFRFRVRVTLSPCYPRPVTYPAGCPQNATLLLTAWPTGELIFFKIQFTVYSALPWRQGAQPALSNYANSMLTYTVYSTTTFGRTKGKTFGGMTTTRAGRGRRA